MSEQNTVNIKQRLLGAIILVSLGVIFIPFLLNGGPDLKYTIMSGNIPEMPARLDRELAEVPQPNAMPAPKAIISRPVGDMGKSISKPANSITQTATLSKSDFKQAAKPATEKIDTAYTLQIASFSKMSNVIALRDKLRKAKFKAYIESINTDKGKIYRLRVGPYLKYDQISAIQKQVEKRFKLNNTVIVQYKT